MANEIRLKELLKKALPYVESYDLVGTGGAPSQGEIDDINALITESYEILDLDKNDMGLHNVRFG